MSSAGGVSPDPNVAQVISAALYGHTWACPDDPESEPPRDACECCARVVLDALSRAGFAVVQPSRYEYTLGWLADTGIWCPFDSSDTHPWLSFMQEQLATHDGDPDWEGTVVLGRPVFAWSPAASLSVGGLPVGEEADK